MTGHARFHTRIYGAIVLLGTLAWASLGHANPLDKSDMNSDGVVDTLDLAIFSDTFLQQDWQTVDWCVFHESSVTNERYFRKITSEKTDSYERLLQFIAYYYYCQGQTDSTEKSDLNGDSIVDVEDLVIFSTNYLEMNWTNVDWCLFYDSTVSGAEFNGRSTKYFLDHFGLLLEFINEYFYCSGEPPPPVGLRLENTPNYLARITSAPYFDSDYYITDPVIGSLFIYDVDLVLKAEIKGLNKPLGVAIDSQGLILVGNNGRDNIEAYNPANGDLVAMFGQGQVKMPTAITLDSLGNIYVTDSLRHAVFVFDSSYNLIRTIGRAGQGQSDLDFPVDAEILVGNGEPNVAELFVADQKNNRVQVFDLQGNWLRSLTFDGLPGTNCHWFTGVCEIPGMPGFTRVQALDSDSLGRLHVLDNFSASVVILNPSDGAYINSYGGYGTEAGLLAVPVDVRISESDMAIVTAGDGDRIEVFVTP